jgi:hypothetical protein
MDSNSDNLRDFAPPGALPYRPLSSQKSREEAPFRATFGDAKAAPGRHAHGRDIRPRHRHARQSGGLAARRDLGMAARDIGARMSPGHPARQCSQCSHSCARARARPHEGEGGKRVRISEKSDHAADGGRRKPICIQQSGGGGGAGGAAETALVHLVHCHRNLSP